MSILDSHCHLAGDEFRSDLESVIKRATDAGVDGAVCIVSADESGEVARALEVGATWPSLIFATGIHPHRSGAFGGSELAAGRAALEAAIAALRPVAIGEIGLDYHYDFAPRDVQREVFDMQLDQAVATDVPVVIHTREASADTFAALGARKGRVRGVLHCFTGTLDEARLALDLGFHLSFSGILTFPKADALREVARFAPLDRVLVETDAPFLAPVPHRGKRNEPAWVSETLAALAATRGEPLAEVAASVRATTERLFRLTGSGASR